jgi:hypothetical protein
MEGASTRVIAFSTRSDLTLVSTDRIQFRVHSITMSDASEVFARMLDQMISDPAHQTSTIELDEDSVALDLLLSWIHPCNRRVIPKSFDQLAPLLVVTKKYDITSGLLIAELGLPDILQPDPLAVLVFCIRHKIFPAARIAAKEVLVGNLDIWKARLTPRTERDLEHVSYWTIKRFDKLREDLNKKAADLVKQAIIAEPTDAAVPAQCTKEGCFAKRYPWMDDGFDKFKTSTPLLASSHGQNFVETYIPGTEEWTRHYNPCAAKRIDKVYDEVKVLLYNAVECKSKPAPSISTTQL